MGGGGGGGARGLPTLALDTELARDFDGLADEVCALLDRAELTQALEAIWQRVRRLNRYVEERAPWTLAKDPDRRDELGGVLASLAEGLRVVSVLLHPYLPVSTTKLLDALGAPDTNVQNARFGAGAGAARRVGSLEPLFPKTS